MTSWRRARLGDFSEVLLGKMLDKAKNKGELHPYLSNKDVRWGTFNTEGLNLMRFESDEHERFGLRHGDIVVCEGGEPGRCAIWRDDVPDMKIQKALHRVRVGKGYSNEFVYYRFLLAGRTGELEKYFIGSTIKHLTGVNLKQVEFNYPDFDTQKRIASVLSALDAKITLNQRINAELEAMAKLLYDYWFVQFDFPISKELAARLGKPKLEGKPYKSSGGPMVHNAELKREVPEGWGVECLENIANLNAGGDKPLKVSDCRTKEFTIPVYSNGITNDGLYGYTDSARIREPSVTISARGTIGYSALRMKPFVPIIRLISVTPRNPILLPFLHEGIKNIDFEDSGSVQKQLTVPMIRTLAILVPPIGLLATYDAFAKDWIMKIELNKEENQELSTLRDWLLPMLMNGQVTVGAAEEKVGLAMAAEPGRLMGRRGSDIRSDTGSSKKRIRCGERSNTGIKPCRISNTWHCNAATGLSG